MIWVSIILMALYTLIKDRPELPIAAGLFAIAHVLGK